MLFDMPIQHRGEGRGAVRRRFGGLVRDAAPNGGIEGRPRRLGTFECREQILERLRFTEQALGQMDRECPLDP